MFSKVPTSPIRMILEDLIQRMIHLHNFREVVESQEEEEIKML